MSNSSKFSSVTLCAALLGVWWGLDEGISASPIRLYYAEFDPPCIHGINFDGSDHRTIMHLDVDAPWAAAIGPDGKIYYIDRRCRDEVVRRANLDGTEVEVLPLPVVSPIDLAIDHETELLYVSDTDAGCIMVSDLAGINVRRLVEYGSEIEKLGWIALDTEEGHIYWVDYIWNRIWRARLVDGTSPELVYTSAELGGSSLVDIDVHPARGLLFFGAVNSRYSRVDLSDGSVTQIFQDDRSFPHGLVVNVHRDELCFGGCDGYPAVRCVALDGSDLRIVADNTCGIALAVDAAGETLFWYDGFGKILRASATGGTSEPEVVLAQPFEDLTGMELDWKHGTMYFVQDPWRAAGVWRIGMDGSEREQIISGLQGPLFLAVDPEREVLFVADRRARTLYAAGLDGTGLDSIFSDASLEDVAEIAVDVPTGRLYVSTIQDVHYLDRENNRLVWVREVQDSGLLALDWDRRVIYTGYRDEGPPRTRGIRGVGTPWSSEDWRTLTDELWSIFGIAIDLAGEMVCWAAYTRDLNDHIQCSRWDRDANDPNAYELATIPLPGRVTTLASLELDWRRIRGDRNGDGRLDWRDPPGIYEYLTGPGVTTGSPRSILFDMEGDGDFDLRDVALFFAAAGD
ncbi:MAG: hypothetical protein PVI86_15295 [Phycisphaerae bacterium]|jgi:sugar lactone lactonase YvrE